MTAYRPHQQRAGDDDWQAQFDACIARLRELDAEEARMRREFVAGMKADVAKIGEAL